MLVNKGNTKPHKNLPNEKEKDNYDYCYEEERP